MSFLRLRRRDDRGVTLIIVALMIVALFTIVAIVIDLGAVRSQRRQGQSAADNSASAAGIALGESNAVAACQDALGYLTLNLSIPAFTGTSCATFAAACVDTTERTTTGTSNEYTVTLVHPVTNGSPTGVMDGSAIASPAQPATRGDGTAYEPDGAPCDRFGVKVEIKGQKYFSGVVGLGANKTSVHAVARVRSGSSESRPLNLLLLDRTGCKTLDLSGQGKVIVRAPIDPNSTPPNQFIAGIAAADSDGSECNGNGAVIDASGNNSLLRADGPCPGNAFLQCNAEGRIEVFGGGALTDGKCDDNSEVPACSGKDDASIQPLVNAGLGRFTRAPVDYRYNCKSSYASEPWYSPPNAQPIPGCSDPMSGSYIDTLKAYASGIGPTSPGWIRVTNAAGPGPGCTVPASGWVYPPGNYYIDCNDYKVQGLAHFQGGNIVFKDKVSITGELRTNTCLPAGPSCGSMTWTPGSPFTSATAAQSSKDASWMLVKGEIGKSGSGNIALNKMLMLVDPGAKVDLSNTGGTTFWIAPTAGPFDDLALWSESKESVRFSGQSDITLEGVFFVPVAEVAYTGGSIDRQTDAQFVAFRLKVTGQGSLGMVPAPNRAVEFPTAPTSGLIR